MTKPIAKIKTMNARGVLSRELRELEVAEILLVPFKYCSVNNIKATVTNLRKEGLQFEYDNSGNEHSVIQRTA